MQPEEVFNFTIDEAIQEYLFISENTGTNKFIDIDNANLIWTFEDVSRQTCYLKKPNSGPEDDLLRENIKKIQNRRTNEILLITDVIDNDTGFWDRLSFERLYSKSFCLLKREFAVVNNPAKGATKKPPHLRSIRTWSEFKRIVSTDHVLSPKVRESLKNVRGLFKQPFFSLFILLDNHSQAPVSILLTFEFNSLFIIEIISITKSANLVWLERAIKYLISGLENENVKILLVSDNDLIKLFNSEFFDNDKEILYQRKHVKKSFFELPPFSKSDTLTRKFQYLECVEILSQLGLPKHSDLPKNWDCLAALSLITEASNIKKDDPILDAGGEYYSPIMHQLASIGFKKLFCINTVFEKKSKMGKVNYEPGDITDTNFANNTFGAVTCLSVIEHGVNISLYLTEMSRILKPGGLLFTSCDYWISSMDTSGLFDYGVPVKIFDKNDIDYIVQTAKEFGLRLLSPIIYKCEEELIECNNLKYTFIYFTFRKDELIE